ncbi:MAG: tRNA (N(6)-L-threonylcarbamoyladenosine(37)-C(2))-methylthiotransferase MtaB [Myxococcales bacterium]|nr:tRNA (N(6)-L-threonylcarbamoyladenosine(37)-C(2))-methylthiotransferase MtaB [Myxococcales bacterium]
MRVAFTTLGCRLNRAESDAMVRMARETGHTIVDVDAGADVVVVNTCTITHEADADARQRIRQIARRWPAARIVATGCYANAAPERLGELPGVALVIGNGEKEGWLGHLEAAREGRVDVVVADLARRRRVTRLRPDTTPGRARALLKIQDGCNYRCAFCVVPSVRGRSTSLPIAALVERFDELAAAGIPEVVLTGVHLGTYGWDLAPRASLAELAGALVERAEGTRLRLGSLDPHELTPALLGLLEAHAPRLARHLHLPAQSGDPSVLRRMRRAHRAEDLEASVREAHARIPGVAIGTDLIVGFPGEDDAAFERTAATLEALPIAYAHVFAYSPRDGTEAATMPDQVPASLRSARSAHLRALSRRKWAAFSASQVGARVSAVVHRARDRRSGALVGLSDNYLKVLFEGDDALLGRRVEVEVVAIDGERLRGRRVAQAAGSLKEGAATRQTTF